MLSAVRVDTYRTVVRRRYRHAASTMDRDFDRSPRHGGSMDRVSKSSSARCSSPHAFPDCSTADRSGRHGRRTPSLPQSPQPLKESAMGFNSHALAGKSLLASALLLSLAACGDAAAPVEEETPAAETVVATPAPVASEPVTELAAKPTNETPSAASGDRKSTRLNSSH